MMKPGALVGIVAVTMMTVACGGQTPVSEAAVAVPPAASSVHRLTQRRVFFGHQSVGFNILDGVRDLAHQAGVEGLRIAEITDANEFAPGTLAHAAVGRNEEPLSKIEAFRQYLESGVGASTDVALLKFCYIDVNASTDVNAIFHAYRDTMVDLKRAFPHLQIVHSTMPLRTVQTGPKAVVKSLLGRPAGGYVENRLRNQYNDLVRAEYGGKEPVFDLAAIESTMPDGSRVMFDFGGRDYFALNPAYTYDNGHLNEAGRLMVARAFVAALAGAE
jgi:hypothetical protein